MKNIALIIYLSFTLLSCKGQEIKKNVTKTKPDTMEYFNNNKYKDLPADPDYASTNHDKHYIASNLRIRVVIGSNIIQVDEQRVNSPYKISKTFHQNHHLKSVVETFFNFPIKTYKEYDRTGVLIRKVNNDAPYKFSIENLREKIKKEYGIDIVLDYNDKDKTRIKISRWLGYNKDWSIYKKNVPMYQLAFINKENKNYILEINATTGETISEQINEKLTKTIEK